MDPAEIGIAPPKIQAARNPGDPRHPQPTLTRFAMIRGRVPPAIKLAAERQAAQLGLSFAEYLRVAIWAMTQGHTLEPVEAAIRAAVEPKDPRAYIPRRAQPFTNPQADLTARAGAVTRQAANPQATPTAPKANPHPGARKRGFHDGGQR